MGIAVRSDSIFISHRRLEELTPPHSIFLCRQCKLDVTSQQEWNKVSSDGQDGQCSRLI